jgi:1-acyl-sn-glycerol-3-phosphate acyltransferase
MKEPYIPDVGIVYPEQPDARMVAVNPVRKVIIDEKYPFLGKTFKFKFFRFLVYLGIHTLTTFLAFVRYGFKVEGKKILRKHRKLFKDGAMTISNHVHRWDFIFVAQAVRYRMMYFPVWKEHLNGRDAGFISHAGGIPIPDDISTMKCFNKAFDEIHKKKIWIHAFPESTRFDYFQPIRPFKKGVFTMVHRYNIPVIPIAISYRESHFPFSIANFFRAKSGKPKLPLITLRIGEPVLLDPNLDRKEAVQKLRKECHEAVVRLAGISNNPYPAEGD